MIYYRILLVALLACHEASSSLDFFREILEPEIFSAHGLQIGEASLSAFNVPVSKSDIESDAPLYFCGPLTDLKSKMAKVSQLSPTAAELSHVVYLKKSRGRGCFVTRLSKDLIAAERDMGINPTWTMEYLPVALKIHTTVLQYLSFTSRKSSSLPDVEFVSKHKRRQSKTDKLKNRPAAGIEEEINQAGMIVMSNFKLK